MYTTKAIIRKLNNKFCVFSKDGKNLGCSSTREGAEKRLREVEYFKHKGSAYMNNNYKEAFDNFAKALDQGFHPETLGVTPDSSPRKINVESETLTIAERMQNGSIAGFPSSNLLDKKEHFPVITHSQAQSSFSRVMQLAEAPTWYNGSVTELRKEVYAGIMRLHPDIKLDIRVPADVAIALSDGETSTQTSIKSIKDPTDVVKSEVPSVSRPSLTSAQVSEALENSELRHAVAGRLMEMIDKQIQHMQEAKKIGERLLKSGIKAEEFDQLSTYIQEDILRELISRGVTASSQASENRRRELIDRMKQK